MISMFSRESAEEKTSPTKERVSVEMKTAKKEEEKTEKKEEKEEIVESPEKK